MQAAANSENFSNTEDWDDFDIFQESSDSAQIPSEFAEDLLKQHVRSKEAYEEFSSNFLEAAMVLADEKGWQNFTLKDVANEADIPFSWVREHIPTKVALFKRLNRQIDQNAFKSNDSLKGVALRDNVFNLFMRRCDGLQAHRQGFLSLLHTIPLSPSLGSEFLTGNVESVTWIADIAGLDRKGIKGFFRLQALGILWAKVLRCWAKDENEELESTMIALNEGLDQLEKFNLLISQEIEN
ncbi:helix-turn-helix transcriptional regulator [Acetobacteraceae bacterium]|nr:helix-turn-helix transcriptional regulator [Acetobacteraceae bacterium]QCE34983.1 helix-turn-helix transcriptional regulator [Acetobacteraceae bacterium]